MLFLSKSSVSVSFVPSRVSEPHAPISICGKVSGLGIRCLGLHRFSERSWLHLFSERSCIARLWVPEACLAGDLWADFRQMLSNEQLAANPSGSTWLVLQCRLHQNSARQTNSKASSWRQQTPADCLQVPSLCGRDWIVCFSVSSVFGGSSSRLLVPPVPRSARVRLDVASRGTGVKPTDMQPTALI